MGLLEVGLALCWVGFGLFFVEKTRNARTDLAGTLNRPDWHKPGQTSPRKFPMEFCGKSYRVDSYSPAKITEYRARLEFRTRLAPVGSDIATVSPDGILWQELSGRLIQPCKDHGIQSTSGISDPSGTSRVGHRHSVSRWNFEARSTTPDS
ncbi:hypothetical protein CRG98_016537 [Punica granatum]|uniref:Uncharacterized protein n=1 Tax=Punica granatum TaxID=22663 RepID=A0A2I0K5W2_PUNGR|nr:hypothetical protein CRG98_016537 [Punica granatum]